MVIADAAERRAVGARRDGSFMPVGPTVRLAALVACLVLTGHPPARAEGAGVGDRSGACLRVLTYNIRGLSGRVPEEVIVDALTGLNADLIGLQEVYAVGGAARLLRDDARAPLREVLRDAGYATFWSSYAGPSPGIKRFVEPVLVLEPGALLAVREAAFEVIEPASGIPLSRYPMALGLGEERRVLQHVGLRWRERDRRIDLYNTHVTNRGAGVDAEGDPSLEEIREIRRALGRRAGDPGTLMLVGDFNLTPHSPAYRRLIGGGGAGPALIDTFAAANPDTVSRPATLDPRNSFFSRESLLETLGRRLTGRGSGPPPLHLDYVFVGPAGEAGFSVRSSEVVLDQRYRGLHNYSDHYGVLSELCAS